MLHIIFRCHFCYYKVKSYFQTRHLISYSFSLSWNFPLQKIGLCSWIGKLFPFGESELEVSVGKEECVGPDTKLATTPTNLSNSCCCCCFTTMVMSTWNLVMMAAKRVNISSSATFLPMHILTIYAFTTVCAVCMYSFLFFFKENFDVVDNLDSLCFFSLLSTVLLIFTNTTLVTWP